MEIRFLKKKQMELQTQNEEAERQLNLIRNQIDVAEDELSALKAKKEEYLLLVNKAKEEYNSFEEKMGIVQTYCSLEEIGFEYTDKITSPYTIENSLIGLEQKIGDMVKNESCLHITKKYIIDGSAVKGEKFQINYGKNIMIGLNAIYNKQINSRSIDLYSARKKIDTAFNKYNKQASLLGITITEEYKELLIDAIKLKYWLKIAKEKERVRIRKEKQQLKEQEKLLAEAEKERKRLEEEKKAMDIAFAKALSDAEREDIKSQLEAIDKRIADIDYRVNNRQAGYLYIISSPALDGMIKIGCTRRLNPTIRVKELSSSSLPFPFVTHGFVFSDNCFDLEANMHKYFEAYRVHPDREFFYVSPKEAINVLKNKFNCEVHFEDIDEEEVCLEL